jgi:hypothetical protein
MEWTLAPGCINLADFGSTELIMGNLLGKAFAGITVGARNLHQILHGRPRPNLSAADVLLHRLGQLLHQRKAARNPGYAPVEPPGEIIKTESRTAM